MVDIVRAGRHRVKMTLCIATGWRSKNHQMLLRKCVLGQSGIIYQRFSDDWSIFRKVTARQTFMKNATFRGPAPPPQ